MKKLLVANSGYLLKQKFQKMRHLFKKGIALFLLSTLLVAADFTSTGNKAKAQVKLTVEGPWDLIHDLICPDNKMVCKQNVCSPGACISFRTDFSGGGQAVCDAKSGGPGLQ
jgi:hypothetical protein